MKKIILSAILCASGLIAVETTQNNIQEKKVEVKELFEKTNIKELSLEEKLKNLREEKTKEEQAMMNEKELIKDSVKLNEKRNNLNKIYEEKEKELIDKNKIMILNEKVKTKEENIKNLMTALSNEKEDLKKREIAEKIGKEQDSINADKKEIEQYTKKSVIPGNNTGNNSGSNNQAIEAQIQALTKSIEEMKKSSASYENLEKIMLKGENISGTKEEQDNLNIETKTEEDKIKEKEDKEKKLLPEPKKIATVGSQKILFASYKEEAYSINGETVDLVYEDKIIKIKEGFASGKWVLTKINMDYIIYTNQETNEEIYRFIDKTPSDKGEMKKPAPIVAAPATVVKKEEKKEKVVQKKIETNSNKNETTSNIN